MGGMGPPNVVPTLSPTTASPGAPIKKQPGPLVGRAATPRGLAAGDQLSCGWMKPPAMPSTVVMSRPSSKASEICWAV